VHESFVVGSGHPRGVTSGWVGDDGTTLYAALDFTDDNTSDPGKDYGALLVRTPAGVRELRDFEFLFEDSLGVPVATGSAAGTPTVTVN
jgi:hypothetical protein